MSDGPWLAKWKQEREAENAAGMAELLRNPKCRAFFANLIEFIADTSTFDADPRADAFKQGRRSVGLDLRETAQKTDFELYYRMLGERANTARAYQAALRNDKERVPFHEEK